MKFYLLIFILFICFIKNVISQKVTENVRGQDHNLSWKKSKTLIDNAAIDHWVSLGNSCSISNDGNYFLYTINNDPFGKNTFVVQSIDGIWKVTFVVDQQPEAIFSEDNKLVVFKNGDTLFYLPVRTTRPTFVTGVLSWSHPIKDKGKWIAYQLHDDRNSMVVHNLVNGREKHYDFVSNYIFNEGGNVIIYKSIKNEENKNITTLWYDNLENGTAIKIWHNLNNDNDMVEKTLLNYSIDKVGKQIAFIVQEKRDTNLNNSIWYFNDTMQAAIIKVTNQSPGIDSGFSLYSSATSFSHDGLYIYIQIYHPEKREPSTTAAVVDVWNYQDRMLQSSQLKYPNSRRYQSVICVKGDKVIRLEHDYETVKARSKNGGFIVVVFNDQGERFWMNKSDKVWLVSMKDGSRTLLKTKGHINYVWFSPNGKYVVYYNDPLGHKNYISYNTITGKTADLSEKMRDGRGGAKTKYPIDERNDPTGIGGWDSFDSTVLVYGEYDIWKLDLSGKERGINLTNNFGINNNIKFRLVNGSDGTFIDPFIYHNNDTLLITSFNIINKYNGFYRAIVGIKKNPDLLTVGPCTFYHSTAHVLPLNANELCESMKPFKAEKSNIWIVKRESATESPNYYLTSDFRKFKPLTSIRYEDNFNWLTADLITFKQPDGAITQGVLYKPEDFDPIKKYPLIINFYEQLSHRVYEYPKPELANSANMNIASFVSRGYVILTVDIHYKQGMQGQNAINSVVGGANYLLKQGYIDIKRMGICGHSWGGSETNYIITHTNLFAAALQGSGGTSDMVSYALGLEHIQFGGLSNNELRMGATLWQRPELWMENSPILRADRITTPFLILHCKADRGWSQSLELFVALWRLGKPVWLLQYDSGGHTLSRKIDREDFSIRASQFFDHYLKGMPPPRWMVEGIPASLRGIERGFDLIINQDRQSSRNQK